MANFDALGSIQVTWHSSLVLLFHNTMVCTIWDLQFYGFVDSKENFDVSRARKILDEDHYGLTDIKERIMEFIAVGKLRGTVQGILDCSVCAMFYSMPLFC